MKKTILFIAILIGFTPIAQSKETILERKIAECDRIGYPEWRDDCYESISKTLQNYALCLKFANPLRQEACFMSNPPENAADCQLNSSIDAVDACLVLLKNEKNDVSVCANVTHLNTKIECYSCSDESIDINDCLAFRAQQIQDDSLCDLCNNKKAKAKCLSSMNVLSSLPGCEQPQSFMEYQHCQGLAQEQKKQKKMNSASATAKEVIPVVEPEITQPPVEDQPIVSEEPPEVPAVARPILEQTKEEPAVEEAAIEQTEEELIVEQTMEEPVVAQKVATPMVSKAQKAREAKDQARLEKQEKARMAREAKDQARAERIQKAKEARETKEQAKAEKIQRARETKELKAQERAERIQAAKDTKMKKSKNTQKNVSDSKELAKEQQKQKAQEAREAKEQAKAEKLQRIKEEKELRAQERAERIQAAKDAKQQAKEEKMLRAQEAREAKEQARAERIQKAQEAREAKEQAKAKKLQRIKEEKELRAQERAQRIQAAKDAKRQAHEEKIHQKQLELEARKQALAERKLRAQEAMEAKKEKLQATKMEKASAAIKITEPEMPMDPAPKTEVMNDSQMNAVEESASESIPAPVQAMNQQALPATPKVAQREQPKIVNQSSIAKVPIAEIGCTTGFGSWVEPPKSRKEELNCDKANMEQFMALLNRCTTTDRNLDMQIMSYDMNKDKCVTCYDFKLWKEQIESLYKAKKRSTNGHSLRIKECRDRKF